MIPSKPDRVTAKNSPQPLCFQADNKENLQIEYHHLGSELCELLAKEEKCGGTWAQDKNKRWRRRSLSRGTRSEEVVHKCKKI
jgi:hypothetical protein